MGRSGRAACILSTVGENGSEKRVRGASERESERRNSRERAGSSTDVKQRARSESDPADLAPRCRQGDRAAPHSSFRSCCSSRSGTPSPACSDDARLSEREKIGCATSRRQYRMLRVCMGARARARTGVRASVRASVWTSMGERAALRSLCSRPEFPIVCTSAPTPLNV